MTVIAHQPQSGRDRNEAERGDGFVVENKTTGKNEVYSPEVAQQKINAGTHTLVRGY